MSSKFILDLVLNEVEFSENVQRFTSCIFLDLKSDGRDEQIRVASTTTTARANWDFPVSLGLTLEDLSRSYIFATLRTADRRSIGRAKIALRALPVGSSRRFRFPVISASNNTIIVAKVTLTAMLSSFALHQPYPSSDGSP
jgi:hypothetical protein